MRTIKPKKCKLNKSLIREEVLLIENEVLRCEFDYLKNL